MEVNGHRNSYLHSSKHVQKKETYLEQHEVNADGSKIEANHGEDVTLCFTMNKTEEAEELKIFFSSEITNKSLIAKHCAGSHNCAVVETPGVKLLVGHGHVNVTIQKVNSSRSGLYEVEPVGKHMPDVNPITLVVNEASSSSTLTPPHTSAPNPSNPPSSSNLFGLCALIPLVISVGRLLL